MKGNNVKIHKLVLVVVLGIGAAALIYNALSIVNGQSGLLVQLPAPSAGHWSQRTSEPL